MHNGAGVDIDHLVVETHLAFTLKESVDFFGFPALMPMAGFFAVLSGHSGKLAQCRRALSTVAGLG